MSAHSSGSFTPTAVSDASQGANAFLARLNTASNAAGLATPTVPGVSYAGLTISNRSSTRYVKAVITFNSLVAPGDSVILIGPNGSESASFSSSVIDSVALFVVDAPAPGLILDADALTVTAAFAGTIDVSVNLINN